MKDKNTAAILALVLGGIGGHKFYLGQTLMGVGYFLFSWTFVPLLVSFVECLFLLTMSHESFNARFNPGQVLLAPAARQNIVVNVSNTATAGAGADARSGAGTADRIKALHELKLSGALTDEEFAIEKQKLLSQGT